MLRYLPVYLLLAASIVACSNLEKHEETDDEGFQTVYTTDPETGEKEGPLKQYLPDGKLLVEENYADGKLVGDRKVYYEDGKLLAEETYADGRFDGPYVNYQQDGKVKQRGQYEAGVMTGKWLAYHANGKVREEVTFADGNENGPFREWYDTGQPKASGNYLNGDKEDGPLHLYAEDGSLKKVMNCEAGLCRTAWTVDSTITAPKGVSMQLER